MEQTFLRGHEFYEATIRHDADNFGIVYFTHFGDSNDSANLSHCSVDAVLVRSRNLNLTYAVCFFDGDGSTSFFLHTLDNLTTRANDSTNEFLRNVEGFDTRYVRLVVFTWVIHSLHHLTEDVFTTSLGLCECFFEDFVRKTIALDVHLRSGQTFERTRGLEVHITEVVFVTEDVGEDSIFVFTWILNQSHCDTRYRSLQGYTCIHERERTSANGSHRRRTVRLEDVAHHTYSVREVGRDLPLQTAPCQVTVTDFTTTYTALSASFTGREGREVVVKEEAHVTLVEHIVYHLFVKFRTEGSGRKALCFTTSEDGTSVRTGERIHFAPDRTDVSSLTTIEAHTFVEDATTHRVFFYIVIVAIDECVLFSEFIFGELGVSRSVSHLKFFANSFESVETFVLFECRLRDVVALLVAVVLHLCAEVFIVHLVAVFALHVLTQFLREFLLDLAHRFDSSVRHFERFEESAFGHFVHFTFHHHDVLFGSSDHEIHVCAFELFESGVDDKFSVDASYANFRDGTVERNVCASQSGRSSKTSESVGHIYAISTEEGDVDENFSVIVRGEEGTEGAVNKTRSENLVVASTTFAFGESTGESTHSGVFFFIVTLERHEIGARGSVFGTANGSEKHGVVHTQHHCAIGLLRELTSLNADGASIRQGDSLCNNVHLILL